MLILLSLVLILASTNSKSDCLKNSEVLKKPADAFGEIIKGLPLKPPSFSVKRLLFNTSSLTFQIPIADGSVSSTLLNSPDKK